ncbi:MAG TPA: hypothetical protein VF411_06480 [Bacteroidia bacterium]
MRLILTLITLILFTSCVDKQVFENKSGTCKLYLYKDSTYKYIYPTLFGSKNEKGSYITLKDAILLKRITDNTYDTYDSINYSVTHLYDNSDTIELSFKNLNDSNICTTFTINKNQMPFKPDNSGNIKLLYHDLIANKIIAKDSTFYLFTISFDNKIYHLKDTFVMPTSLEIKLNQYIDKKTAILYRQFEYKNDTVFINEYDPKVLGVDFKLTKVK